MTPREQYEAHQREAVNMARDIRTRLYDTYMDYAKAAQQRHEWEAATAYETAANLALSTCVQIGPVSTMAA